ncbi:hypothetical protein, variant 2 [Microbotryum lychnidis-dioicae p1A1 Lamole]|uniref:Uncharacterized protein n=1 Tax=Microbotryum lychnidis-dioicae (strain p1A1 Lamole / MvSl-1064) TaxID=683840 RepID=U5HG75_USTV1|nr:hypothetical protein MVLG_06091 [Microbotryum lychnidis-dioicae p1A1 Lamole]KDE03427.1 hypothetical protein, variant 1 [Microbotryum lychnidis-dioicae p1A1 Lamole]KDE03428.1 hypothetical protein, variant 2 [Microbotryum lychnidis-dioicae p1A1 Lamole]|eukprot:KDE03426.1 hypothetical protein MVLG_06091 [Microbotryum lychnidis-dioicae p1A1 Lamole]
MVWVLHGTVDCRAETAPELNSIPPRSSHLLRPGRTYRLGRLPNQAQKVKNRLHDFYLNSSKISKSGTWETTIPSLSDGASSWAYEDDPTNPKNLDPYPLILKGKVQHRGSDGKLTAIDGESVNVKSGDSFAFGAIYEMTFEWVPLIFGVSSATVAKKSIYADLAKSVGFKIAYKAFRPHHTHYLTKKLTPNASLMSAALVGSHVADPSYLDKLAACTTYATPPASEMPPPRPQGADKDSAVVLAWEAQVYEAHPDAGSDPEHWWGKSILEADWSVFPSPKECPCNIDPQFPTGTTEGWSPNPRRRTMFRDVIALPFQEDPEGDPSGLLELGGAHLISRDMLPLDRSISALRHAIDDYKHVKGFEKDLRFAIIPPEGFEPLPALNEPAEFKTVRQLAQALGEAKFVGHPMIDLLQAIYDADPAQLLGPLVMVPPTSSPEVEGSPVVGASLSRLKATSSDHIPLPSSELQYTLGDQSAPSTAAVQTQAPGSAEEAASAPAPTIVRRLKRHRRDAPSKLDELFGLDKPSAVEGDEPPSHAQEPDPLPSVSLPAASTVEIDVPSSSQTVGEIASKPAPTARRFLKRRAVSSDPPSSLFDEVGSSSSSVPEAKRTRYDSMTREARLRKIQEEDDAEAAKELERQRAGKVISPDDVEVVVEVVTPKAGRGRKRSIDQTAEEGDGDEDEEDGTPKKGKGRAKTASKRARSESAQPAVVVDDEEEHRQSTGNASPHKSQGTKKKGKGKASNQVIDDEAGVEQAPVLLQVTSRRGKGKAALMEQELNDDFNRLKIVKPNFKMMNAPERHRMTWDEIDSNEEHMRLVRDDQEQREEHDVDDPNFWAGKPHGMFVVKKVHFPRPQTLQPRFEDTGQWAGRANFKAFKPKEALGTANERSEPRPPIRLAPIKRADYGIGKSYKTKGNRNPGMLGTQSQTQSQSRQVDDDDDDDDDFGMDSDGFQPMLNFGSTAKARTAAATKSTKSSSTNSKSKDGKGKGKGKAKIAQVFMESDDDPFSSDDLRPSRAVISDVEEVDEMDVDDSDTAASRSTASKKRGRSAPSQNGSSMTVKQLSLSAASTTTRQSRAKAPVVRAPSKMTITVLTDDSDDSDSGLTFKGFETKKRKR